MKNKTRKKREPWIDLALIFSIITLIGVIILLTTNTNNLKDIQNIFAESSNTNSNYSLTETDSPYPGIITILEQEKNTNTPYHVEYPETTSETLNNIIKTYIADAKKQYKSAIQLLKDSRLDKKIKAELNIDYTLYTYDDNYYSIKFIQKQVLQTNEDTFIQTFVFNRETGKVMTISNLFSNDVKNYATFTAHVKAQLLNSETFKGIIDKEKINTIFSSSAPIKHFIIQNEQLIIYLDEGSIAQKEHGIIEVPISLSYLNPILTADFQKEMTDQTEQILIRDDNKKRVALTFDDGPHPTVTKEILEYLEHYNAKATFFMLGDRVQLHPEIAKEVLNRGHEIGNHTWSHPILTKLSMDQVMQEFNSTEKIIDKTLGQKSTIFRPPYGISNEAINLAIPLPSVNWTIDTLDWKHRNEGQALSVIKKKMHNNAIILMHDIHQSTADGLIAVLEYLTAEGYEFVTVSELMAYQK